MKIIFTFILTLSFTYLFSQDITGTYFVNGKGDHKIIISKVTDQTDVYTITTNENWVGTGIFYTDKGKKTLMSVFKYTNTKSDFDRGVHSAELMANGNFKVSIRLWRDVWNEPLNKISYVTWIKQD